MKIPILIFTLTTLISQIKTIGIRSDLDFDNENHNRNTPRIIERVYAQQNAPSQNANSPSKIGVICASDGCNTTKSSTSADPDAVSADVVVQVQVNNPSTNDKNLKNTPNLKSIGDNVDDEDDGDVPDVPIVVGTNTAVGNGGFVSLTPPEHVIRPDNANNHRDGNNNFYYHYQNQDHVKTGGGFVPSLGISVEFKPKGHYPTDYTKYHTNGNGYGYGVPGGQRPLWNTNTGYNNNNNNYNPVPWYRRYDRVTPQPLQPATTCVCHPNSVWSGHGVVTPPSTINFNNPGKQINDKIAPLH